MEYNSKNLEYLIITNHSSLITDSGLKVCVWFGVCLHMYAHHSPVLLLEGVYNCLSIQCAELWSSLWGLSHGSIPSDAQKPQTADRDTVAKATMTSDSSNLTVPFHNKPRTHTDTAGSQCVRP